MLNWTPNQQKAIETSNSNIIVSAGAGSGKTAVLTSRVINKLKNNMHINELLILTFTNAAASEMKERIRKALKKEPNLKEELELIDASYITTFDSFALSVVKKYHYYLNIPKDIGITDYTIIKMQQKEIIDEIFNDYYSKDDENFQKLINDFCVKDDKEIKEAILNIANKLELRIDKEKYLDAYIETHFNDTYLDTLLADYINLLRKQKEEIKEALYDLQFYAPSDYYEKVSAAVMPVINEHDLDKVTLYDIKIPQAPRNSDDTLKTCKDSLKRKLDSLKEYRYYGTLKEIREHIVLTKETTTIIIDILKEYFAKLKEYKNNNYIYDFLDIEFLAIDLVKNNANVRDELKDTFKEIMIDEYQDTNDIQEEFIKYISNNNVYMVGDIKQSIYRFRNANPYIFKEKYDKYSQNQGGIKFDLLENFRSREETLDNINTIFKSIMDDTLGGADYLNSHQMVCGNKTYNKEGHTTQDYNMEFLTYESDEDFTNEEIEIFAIGHDILNKINNKYQVYNKDELKLHDATFNDFVILLDRSTSFINYKRIFEYLGIPLTIYSDEKVNEGYDFAVIKSLIDIVIHIHENNFDTKFKYDFISIARSYLYCLDDEDIFSYFSNENYQDAIIYKDLEEIASNISHQTIYETLNALIMKTNLYEKLTTTDDIDNSLVRIDKILELAISLGDTGYDIYDFNTYLENLINDKYEISYTLNNDKNSVRIMTIHKSKGLEYNICYFAGLTKSFNLRDITEKFTYSQKYGLIAPLFAEGIKETIVKELLKKDYIKEEVSEKIRLLYVALTRAKEKMLFVVPNKDYIETSKNEYGVIKNTTRNSYRSFMDIILSLTKDIQKFSKNIALDSLNLTKDYLYNKDMELNITSKEKLAIKEIAIQNQVLTSSSYSKKLHEVITKEQSNNLEMGLKVHAYLELIDFNSPNYELIESDFIKDSIKTFLASHLMQNIKDARIYKEYEFIYDTEEGLKHGIIDLMLEYANHIDIIDYKLNNILDENYLKQLNGYKNYISTISSKEVNLYLYSIVGKEIKKIS